MNKKSHYKPFDILNWSVPSNHSQNIWDKTLNLDKLRENLISIFQQFLLVSAKFLFRREDWALVYNSMIFLTFPNFLRF